jgi:hypothetical protein
MTLFSMCMIGVVCVCSIGMSLLSVASMMLIPIIIIVVVVLFYKLNR